MKIKVKQFESKNQFIIKTKNGEYFQSYDSIIAFIPYGKGKTKLDRQFWDYSNTTGKYRNRFLGDESIDITRKKIKSREYKLANLN